MTTPSRSAWALAFVAALGVHTAAVAWFALEGERPSDVGGAGKIAPVWGIPGALFAVDGVNASEATVSSPTPIEEPIDPTQQPVEPTPVAKPTEQAETLLSTPNEVAESTVAATTPEVERPVASSVSVPNQIDAPDAETVPTETASETIDASAAGQQSMFPPPMVPSDAVAVAVPLQSNDVTSVETETTEATVMPPIPLPNPRRHEREAADRAAAKAKAERAARRERERQQTAAVQASTAQRQTAGSGQQSGRNTSRAPGPGQAEISNYSGRVLSHLQRRKRYPRAAARKKLTGSVRLRFTIGRNGRVSAARITRSSGHQVFDQEVLAMVRRANPFPSIPAGFNKSSMSFSVTIRFAPR